MIPKCAYLQKSVAEQIKKTLEKNSLIGILCLDMYQLWFVNTALISKPVYLELKTLNLSLLEYIL